MPTPRTAHSACIAYIAMGSNLGRREQNIADALALLAQFSTVEAESGLVETEAVGGPEGQPRYLNGAARIVTELSARELLERLLKIESQLGRERTLGQRNLPRTLDLDLLLYGDLRIDEPEAGLQVPHPRMHEREFVLRPLAEIAPEVVHPVLKKTVKELLETIRNKP